MFEYKLILHCIQIYTIKRNLYSRVKSKEAALLFGHLIKLARTLNYAVCLQGISHGKSREDCPNSKIDSTRKKFFDYWQPFTFC